MFATVSASSACDRAPNAAFCDKFASLAIRHAHATLLQEGSMKRILLSTSALFAMAGFASAQGGGGD